MKALVQKLISTGADFSTKRALKNTLNYLGIRPENIDKLYVELKNSVYSKRYDRIPPEDKIVFLPQCLRNSKTCKAVLGKYGWECKKCSGYKECKIYAIKTKAEPMGYRVFVCPGGSMVFKIIRELEPKAVLGVACIKELVMAVEELNIPSRGVPLKRDGCIDTDVSTREVFESL